MRCLDARERLANKRGVQRRCHTDANEVRLIESSGEQPTGVQRNGNHCINARAKLLAEHISQKRGSAFSIAKFQAEHCRAQRSRISAEGRDIRRLRSLRAMNQRESFEILSAIVTEVGAVSPAHGAANGNHGVENLSATLKCKREHDAIITLTGDRVK